jgi:hypothetical protein
MRTKRPHFMIVEAAAERMSASVSEVPLLVCLYA